MNESLHNIVDVLYTTHDSPVTVIETGVSSARLGVAARKRTLDSVNAPGALKIASANANATTTEAVKRRHL